MTICVTVINTGKTTFCVTVCVTVIVCVTVFTVVCTWVGLDISVVEGVLLGNKDNDVSKVGLGIVVAVFWGDICAKMHVRIVRMYILAVVLYSNPIPAMFNFYIDTQV